MAEMCWLKVSCPLCSSNQRCEPKYWSHANCSKTYSEDNDLKIDIDGYIFCNGCHLYEPLIQMRFHCGNHDYQSLKKPINLEDLLKILQPLIGYFGEIKFAQLVKNLARMYEKL